ncbi:hypothetical protein EQ827_03335 [Lactobacillus bombi]|nr:hypothetical protein [Bombilactobacillus bombi]
MTAGVGGIKSQLSVAQAASNTSSVSLLDIDFKLDNQQQFIQKIAPVAQKAAKKYNLYPSVMMAQAILESNWGSSTISQAPYNNFFGIKGSYNKASVAMATQEWSADKDYYTIKANFRTYPDMKASFNDNGMQLRSNPYYSGVWRENITSYQEAADWLQGRYATDPDYASKLKGLIRHYNLTQYDGRGSESAPHVENVDNGFTVQVPSQHAPVNFYSPLGVALPSQHLNSGASRTCSEVRFINGQKFYRVSTYEWLKADDVVVVND